MLVHVQWRNASLKCSKHLVTKLQLEYSYQKYWELIGQYQVSNSHRNFRASIYDRRFPSSYVHLLCSWYCRSEKFCHWTVCWHPSHTMVISAKFHVCDTSLGVKAEESPPSVGYFSFSSVANCSQTSWSYILPQQIFAATRPGAILTFLRKVRNRRG